VEDGRNWADLSGLPAGFSGWLAMRAKSWNGFTSDISTPVEFKLLPMRTVDSYDGSTLANLPGETPWTIEDDPARGPARSKVFSDGPGPYPPNARRRLTLREIPLANIQHLAISWWSRTALEPKWDTGNVLVSYQGKSGTMWHTVDSVTGLTDWQLKSVDVTHLAFLAVAQGADRIQFHFELNSDDTVEYEGWLLDDITISINDSLIKATGIPNDVAKSQALVIGVTAPPGTLYTTSLMEGSDPVRGNCMDDAAYANPAPLTSAGETTRLVQDTKPGKFLCLRTQVPGYRGFVHSWAAWQLHLAEINVVAAGHPTGESNLKMFDLLVNAGSTGVATAFSAALTRPVAGSDGCARASLAWSNWIETGRTTKVDVQAFVQGNGGDGDVTLCVRGRDSLGNVQQKPLQVTWRTDLSGPDVSVLSPVSSPTRQIQVSAGVSGPPDLVSCVALLVQGTAPCPQDPAAYGAACAVAPASQNYTLTADGPWKLCVTGRDRAGNASPTPGSRTWIRDTLPPVATFGKLPPKRTSQTVVEFTVNGPQVVDYQWVIPGSKSTCANATYSAFKSVANPTSVNAGGPGNKTICVRGRDAAGNVQLNPTSYQWTVIPRGAR
jgi:hypothetical protein